MPKGQQRSNREHKKPKQPKKPVAVPSTSSVTPSRAPGPVAVKNLRGRAAPVLVRGDVDSMTKGVAENASF